MHLLFLLSSISVLSKGYQEPQPVQHKLDNTLQSEQPMDVSPNFQRRDIIIPSLLAYQAVILSILYIYKSAITEHDWNRVQSTKHKPAPESSK